MVQITLKELIDQFQQNLKDPTSIIIAIEETVHIIKDKRKTEISAAIEWYYSDVNNKVLIEPAK